jgi:hypothetical protein
LKSKNTIFDRIFDDQASHEGFFQLSKAMDAIEGLAFDSLAPSQVEGNDT